MFFPGTALQNRRHTNRWITGLCVALKQEVKMAFLSAGNNVVRAGLFEYGKKKAETHKW